MGLKKLQIALLLSLILSAWGCSSAVVPPGNVEALNDDSDQLAPRQRSSRAPNTTVCQNDLNAPKKWANDGMETSESILKTILGENATGKENAIVFTSANSGFFSVTTPPGESYAELMGLPVKGIVGGTDIFEFWFENGKYQFKNLGEPINSETWDSHPGAIADEHGNVFLVFSSDRNQPFDKLKTETDAQQIGYTDLYYAFKIDGVWSEPKSFSAVGGGINSSAHDMTPSIYCACYRPLLLFSSNRGDASGSDFDLYCAEIRVDFKRGKVTLEQAAMPFKKGAEEINTYSSEKFPVVARPYPQPPSSLDSILYFSSNRAQEPYKVGEVEYQSKGGYDLYHFPLNKIPFEYKCEEPPPPKVRYELHIVDRRNPYFPVKSPVAKVEELGGESQKVSGQNPAVFMLEENKSYKFFGGSTYDDIDCEEAPDRALNYYGVMSIEPQEPLLLNPRSKVIEYDTIVGGKMYSRLDTSVYKEFYPISRISEAKTNLSQKEESYEVIDGDARLVTKTTDEIIKSIELKDDSTFTVAKLVVKKSEWMDGGRVKTKYRKITIYDTIPRTDTNYRKITDAEIASLRTKNGYFSTVDLTADTTIRDTVYLDARYFVKPPCMCEFIRFEDTFHRNVPYYQSGFWEVNTTENLEKHLKMLRTQGAYKDARWVELHPNNKFFGAQYPNSRARRIYKYKRKFAPKVDANLEAMSEIITDRLLPSFERIETVSPGNKMLIKIEAYSDARHIERGWYIGEDVDYMQGVFYRDQKEIEVEHIHIPNGAFLGEDNDTLSKLRAFYGYKALMNFIEKRNSSIFKKYMENNQILTPDSIVDNKERLIDMLRDAKVIVLIEGMYFDSLKVEHERYTRRASSYYDLDTVRRIDVVVDIIKVQDDDIIKSPCCNELLPCPPTEEQQRMIIAGLVEQERLRKEREALGISEEEPESEPKEDKSETSSFKIKKPEAKTLERKKEEEVVERSITPEKKEIEKPKTIEKDESEKKTVKRKYYAKHKEIVGDEVFSISFGSFADKKNAEELVIKLEGFGIPDVRIERAYVGGNTFYRVRSGNIKDLFIAEMIAAEYDKIIKKNNIQTTVTIEETHK